MKTEFKENIKLEEWCLYFDGKQIDKEVQVVILKKAYREVRIEVLVLSDGKSATIFSALKSIIDDYDLWNFIKVIICDITSVNTGHKRGDTNSESL